MLKEIIEKSRVPKITLEEKTIDGIYVEAEVCERTRKTIKQFAKSIGIDSDFDDYHSTVIYSKKEVPESELIKIRQTYPENISIYGFATGYKKFINKEQDIYAIVLEVKCPKLEDLHKQLMERFDLIYDYDEYIVHITLTYKGKDIDIEDLPEPDFEVRYTKLNVEPLNTDWAKDAE